MNRLFYEESLVNDVANTAESQHVIVELGFFPAIDLAPLTVHINDVAKKPVPIWMRRKGLHHLRQDTGTIAIIRVQDVHDFARGALDDLVHGMVVSFVIFGTPSEVMILLEDLERAVCGSAVHDEMLPVRIILASHTLNGFADGGETVKTGGDH